MSDKAPTRKHSTPIKVYCLPEEKVQIEANAKAAGMSAARFSGMAALSETQSRNLCPSSV